jgi:hypothetical protein
MAQSPFWEDNHSASHEIICLLCNPKVRYRVHMSATAPDPEPDESDPHLPTLFS